MSIRDKISTMLACLCEEGMITANHGQRLGGSRLLCLGLFRNFQGEESNLRPSDSVFRCSTTEQ